MFGKMKEKVIYCNNSRSFARFCKRIFQGNLQYAGSLANAQVVFAPTQRKHGCAIGTVGWGWGSEVGGGVGWEGGGNYKEK